MKAAPRGQRPRDAAATRQEIVDAARHLFAQRGYEGTTVRDVAAEAGITQGLVTRYFGSKEGLFLAVSDTALHLADVLAGPRETFGRRLAESIVARWQREQADDPLLVLMRAASTRPEAADVLAGFMARESTAPLTAQLGAYGMPAAEAAQRTAAIEAVIMGTVVAQRMMPPAGAALPDPAALRAGLAASLQALLDHPGMDDARS